ncbi:hypothetical protein BGP78_13325 [Pseudoalteromonas sp. MSK9-3]|uniref:FIST signal transduction protein n=1 Tax=Pseudoalteromonas sp. MSK9-3 TaxID=1897633 RepID=UPI000E6D3FBE|nr:FIST C-terminal domain-containing protein [Pseudoalteromonas sp. MSK9-3]RJE76383.1 hypothetical protein BGP78_13325 [Pseudoalteromonas sp. MSK9-3]
MFKFNCYSSDISDTQKALNDVATQCHPANKPTIILVYFDVQLNAQIIWQWLTLHFPATPFILSSSCQGSLCHNKHDDTVFATLTITTIEDDSGQYHIRAGNTQSQSVYNMAQQTAKHLLTDINSEPPELLWVTLTPGDEEAALNGIQDVIGTRVPIVGGSASDNDVTGQWQIFTHASSEPCQMAIVSLTPSVPISFSFSSGYAPSGRTTEVTESSGRQVTTLDGIDAASQYNHLTNGAITEQLHGGNILGQTSFHPIGREVSKDEYLLSHPERVNDDGTMTLFSQLEQGDHLHIMQGSTESLLQRAHKVIQSAQNGLAEPEISGCLLIYCAGCMLSVKPQFEQVSKNIKKHFSATPVTGAYTFGEQGCFLDGQSRHGNLMISAVVFGV